MTFARSPTVERVVRGDLCSGCGLCAGVAGGALEMITASPGYARPRHVGPVTREAERAIAAACPGAVIAGWPREADMYWGPAEVVATAHATDDEVRFNSSSGGALTALAIFALSEGLVDGVVHTGASAGDPIANELRVSRDPGEIAVAPGRATPPRARLHGWAICSLETSVSCSSVSPATCPRCAGWQPSIRASTGSSH